VDAYDISWDTPRGEYFILGGHRPWISPEVPEKTNIPDKSGTQARLFPGGVELTGASGPGIEGVGAVAARAGTTATGFASTAKQVAECFHPGNTMTGKVLI
jgi:hypothetical protein